ncbi:MAG: hypothetical protein OZSIB_3514 [Candidatus Ozemobacter sibiricus]|uniref:Carrier domain-containing protein n=1 Tax=Candidatus Ozemobacter sibiricus TaxID=2268124 RepID=A0A367ZSH9_9BACT|nr:MAG: hypothetical protein OZSIB_3514 [Candidatus Ozemobacter sibiricus]
MTLEEKVVAIVAKTAEKKKTVTLDTDLVHDLGTDSLAVLMIIQALEDEFDIAIPDDAFKTVKTVREIVAQLRAHFPHLEPTP